MQISKKSSLLRYVLVGFIAFVIEMFILVTLNNILGINTNLAVTISFSASILTTFLLQKFIAFSEFTRTIRAISKQLSLYAVLLLFNYFLSLIFVSLIPDKYAALGRSVVILLSTIWNYYIYKNYIFSNQRSTKKLYSIFAIIILGFALLFYVLHGLYIRPTSDDFALLGAARTLDVFDYLKYLFGINGRLSALIVYFIGYSIPGFLYLVPLISTSFLVLGAIYLYKGLTANMGTSQSPARLHIILGLLTVFASYVLTTTYGLYASAFWLASAPVHAWSYGLLMFYYGITIQNQKLINLSSNKKLLTFVVLPLVVATLNESVAIFIIIVNSCLITWHYIKTKELNKHLLYGLTASTGSLLYLYFSPGSSTRRSIISSRLEGSLMDRITQLPSFIINDLLEQLPSSFTLEFVLVLVFCLALIVGVVSVPRKLSIRSLAPFTIVVLASLTLYLINISTLYLMTARPITPLRMHYLASLIIALIVVITGSTLGIIIKNKPEYIRRFTVGIAISILTLGIATNFADYISTNQSFSKEIKSRQQDYEMASILIAEQIDLGVCNIKVSLPDLPGANYDPNYYNMYRYFLNEPELFESFIQDKELNNGCGISR